MRPYSNLTTKGRLSRRLGAIAAVVALTVAQPVSSANATERVEDGKIWMLPQYRVPGCEPMPSVPTVFNWLLRKALAVEEFMATSADCGQVGRKDAGEGWTYVFWSESEDTAVAGLLRKAREKYGLTQLLLKKPHESHAINASGYEAFFLIQLGGDVGPMRVWAAGDVARLTGSISMAESDAIGVEVETVTFEGQRCVAKRVVRPDRLVGGREHLPCS